MQFYAVTVGFKDSESPPVLIAGPDVSVPDQEDALDAKARVDDGDGFAVIEIVFSNGRPTRRVTFTTPEEKAAQQAKAAEAATAKAEAEAKAKADRIAELKAELNSLESPYSAEPVAETAEGADAPIGEKGPEGTAGAVDEDDTAPAPVKAGAVSGKRRA
jgi:hypothetical protein